MEIYGGARVRSGLCGSVVLAIRQVGAARCNILEFFLIALEFPAEIRDGYVWQQFGDTAALIAGTCVIVFGIAAFLYEIIS
jgi:hypothetical protein